MSLADEQQFCLRWNNFQANITSQFEALRDDEDFTDVTIACEGQKIQAHKVVLSACSPFFKELFKTNPCSHPIVFMRDVEAKHVLALMEFMYAGQVNVAQAQLSTFLKTAESLKIRGLTDTSGENQNQREENITSNKHKSIKHQISSTSTVTSSQDISNTSTSPPPVKKQKSDNRAKKEEAINPFASFNSSQNEVKPKLEIPDYLSDEDVQDEGVPNLFRPSDAAELPGGMEIIPQICNLSGKDLMDHQDILPQGNKVSTFNLLYFWWEAALRLRKKRSEWLPYDLGEPSEAASNTTDKKNKLVKLGEGIEIYEDQLRSVKWSDYRKLTRGLATILFSPAELATCSVTGQRWSRAGTGERPVKPALDRSKVQAIICAAYVASRFPMVEISRIKQVLAYKCKENSTAFKMKAVRYYEDQSSK